ncbi:RNA helicase [Bifidobacterium dolichotidis]|uniref:RNA helicase n=1 Tax=Bifidobacterium dolichotidis TaxID=2306976 RepID=A0A430FP17_9BIFI|nr:DUF3427 domain-containing protein [Bifidobacterium dolichotidis]RSX54568.1 RNA helicase [Bifidobacterium dolichotidis]
MVDAVDAYWQDPLRVSEEFDGVSSSTGQNSVRRAMLADVTAGFFDRNTESTGAYAPVLIANRPTGESMADALSEELRQSKSFDMSVAFVSPGAIQSLLQDFYDHANNRETRPSHIITSTKNYFNDPKAFWQLFHLQEETGIEVRIWNDTSAETASGAGSRGAAFHPKGYVFSRRTVHGEPYINLYVGSSNLTSMALQKQREWNLRVSSLANGDLVRQVQAEIKSQLSDSVPLTDEWIEQYEREFEQYRPPRRELLDQQNNQPIEPNKMQREALARLAELRADGEHKAIIVSATGTGKTYLSAFDVKAYFAQQQAENEDLDSAVRAGSHVEPVEHADQHVEHENRHVEQEPHHVKHTGRMLYVAQQQQILQSARKSYQKVLGCDADELGLLSGTSKQSDRRIVFATVQTLSQPEVLQQFASDEFDYILFDEVHHAAAPTYQRVMEHFSGADFMLGMTATPERTDGLNIFELFDYNIAFEIRLQKALDEDMLCPFHYYGIAEYLGDEDEAGQQHSIAVSESTSKSQHAQLTYEIEQLASPDRVDYIIAQLRKYGEFHTPVTGLVFCSSVEEAHKLSDLFNERFNEQAERNYRTAAVTGRNSDTERAEFIQRLTNGELDYLFTVDLFNEGIDIPPVNQIVMLRNTQSSIVFTQQLGRGLRKFPQKSSCTVIDFIGNYANNYQIPIALYGNSGSQDVIKGHLRRRTIGLSSISFDHIARERVLKAIDKANLSAVRSLREHYLNVRYELGRIPMLVDMYRYDDSLPYTLASWKDSYYTFVCAAEKYLEHKKGETSFITQLKPLNNREQAVLKMATEILLQGLRPQELVILDELCGITGDKKASRYITRDAIQDRIQREYAYLNLTEEQAELQLNSALRVLSGAYFVQANRKRFGNMPLVVSAGNGRYELSPDFAAMLGQNATFRKFFVDNVRVGLLKCEDLIQQASAMQRQFDGLFLYGHMYSVWDVMRLCGWQDEHIPQNVVGYELNTQTGSLPIFVKYDSSPYEDRFINRQELRWFSRPGRSLASPEFQWLRSGTNAAENELGPDGSEMGYSGVGMSSGGTGIPSSEWEEKHFIPLFVARAATAEKEKRYYYVGRVDAVTDSREVVKATMTPGLTTPEKAANLPKSDEQKLPRFVLSTLHLERPLDPELFQHLIDV